MESLKEAIKEMLRVVVLSVLPIVMSGINPQTGSITIDWQIIKAVAILAVLRFIDKFLHEKNNEGKGVYDERKPSGLLPF